MMNELLIGIGLFVLSLIIGFAVQKIGRWFDKENDLFMLEVYANYVKDDNE